MKHKLSIMYSILGVLVLTTVFVFWAAGMTRGGWSEYVLSMVVLLFTFSLATISMTLWNLREGFQKEREEIGNPKVLLRNYMLIGFLVFTTVAGMSFFDVMRIAHKMFLLAGWQHQQMSTSPVNLVKLPNLMPYDEEYLPICFRIVNDMKAIGSKVVLVPLPSDFSPTEKNYPILKELTRTGIVVFGVQPAQSVQPFQGAWAAYHPTNFQTEATWGVLSTEALSEYGPSQYVPYDFWVISSILKVPDISVELVKKYAGYPHNLEVKRVKNRVAFGDYEIPVFRGGYTYVTTFFHTPDSSVEAFYNNGSRSITYLLRSLIDKLERGSADSIVASKTILAGLYTDKIAMIFPYSESNFPFRNLWYYDSIILSILTGKLLHPMDDWNVVFILLSIILAAWLCYRLPPLHAAVTLAATVIIIFVGGLFLLSLSNVFVETLYMIVSIGLCLAFMPLVKLSQKKGALEERMTLEVEKKKILQSQKEQLEHQVAERTSDLRTEKEKSDRLLYNILPKDIADELKESGVTPARRFEEVSILFTDFRGFTATVASVPASRLVDELNDIFHHVDDITERSGLEKIKTIGDAYMAVAGLPKESNTHAVQAVKAALQILTYIDERNKTSFIKWEMRVGIHSGTVVAGVVGKWKFTYDVWGDAVNIASRLESSGVPGKINISAFTYDLIKNQFNCEYRGKIDAKGKGEIDMYLVVDEKVAGEWQV